MQQSSSHIGNARREERVPLAALIELRSEFGDEALAADGLDVSPSGIAVRAAFVPEVGTRLFCDFRCPPNDDAVHAVGEVAWATWDGPRSGSFGLRFLELDTKSATTIRRYVQPESVPQPVVAAPPSVASMRIDGVPTPIEADVRLLEKDCIVLEQELSFLRLGRGIEVDVPGRGKERGRIASIELRQGPLDTPTLVFGVLLDEKPVREAAGGSSGASTTRDVPDASDPQRGEAIEAQSSMSAEAQTEVVFGEAEPTALAARVETAAEPALKPAVRVETERKRREEPQVVRSMSASERRAEDDAAEEFALRNRTPEFVVLLRQFVASVLSFTRGTLVPWLRARLAKPPAPVEGEPAAEQVPWAQRVLLPLARARSGLATQWSKFQKQRAGQRRTTAPTPRVQRSQPVRTQRPEVAPSQAPRNRRLLTLSLAMVGVGLGVYALAPRSGADRIRVRNRAAEASASASSASELASTPSSSSVAPSVQQLAPSLSSGSSGATPSAEPPAAEPSEPSPSLSVARFGEASVPNGRTFVLRMSGPVTSLEGEKRDDGFSVRIPGRLALDRASPIATSHRAVARALILNRGEYAELTVEFLPGMRPKYQVAGKDNTLEVTLERL
jgi:hypothetical protein